MLAYAGPSEACGLTSAMNKLDKKSDDIYEPISACPKAWSVPLAVGILVAGSFLFAERAAGGFDLSKHSVPAGSDPL